MTAQDTRCRCPPFDTAGTGISGVMREGEPRSDGDDVGTFVPVHDEVGTLVTVRAGRNDVRTLVTIGTDRDHVRTLVTIRTDRDHVRTLVTIRT
ncbi:hypothetical protein, partial [Streptomyces humi]|uniref:hypothetical protein n=1 Tax=Streptomyces humi TaxID=1428620 RepID=UPI00142E4271